MIHDLLVVFLYILSGGYAFFATLIIIGWLYIVFIRVPAIIIRYFNNTIEQPTIKS